MAGFSYRQGEVTVKLNGALEAFARAAADRVAPGVVKGLEDELLPLFVDAKDDWPVKTGVSRAGLDMDVLVDADRDKVRARITNSVPYAIYVRPKKLYGATTAWERYVRSPMRKLQKKLVDALARRIREEIERG